MLKRGVDIALAALLLVVSLPLLAVAAIAIKMDSEGPVLFCQERMGRRFRRFQIVKLRTMRVGGNGPAFTLSEDPRITRRGRWLRRHKVDELPQLWNVLCGEMSLVGPRPEVIPEVLLYTEDEKRLLEVRPGITDWASIRFRNEGEILRGSADPHAAYRIKIRPEKIRLGLEYVERHSFWTDCKIIVNTLRAIRE